MIFICFVVVVTLNPWHMLALLLFIWTVEDHDQSSQFGSGSPSFIP